MAKDRPAEFPTDWHFEQHLRDLEREVLGQERRLLELKDLPDANVARQEAESALEAARAQLAHYGKGQKKASTRPKTTAKKETR